ncbi:MAG: hypothetical protein JW954_00120 [Dehalococcoidaceae bacterium]|nr:hypothetical protein [Dehalococcoidaceae bacterium]
MIENLRLNKSLWVITALAAMAAAFAGIKHPGIYEKVVSNDIMPGVLAQDGITLAASVVLLVLALIAKANSMRIQVIGWGIMGYFFYAFGIYIIEQIYNVMYYVYMAVFALSFWSIAYGLAKTRQSNPSKVDPGRIIRCATAVFAFVVGAVFTVMWFFELWPLIQTGNKIEFLYSVYILDLCFIMPAFFITGIMALKKMPAGILTLPATFVLGFALMLSLAIAEVVKPIYNLQTDTGGLILYSSLSAVFLVLGAFYINKMKPKPSNT